MRLLIAGLVCGVLAIAAGILLEDWITVISGILATLLLIGCVIVDILDRWRARDECRGLEPLEGGAGHDPLVALAAGLLEDPVDAARILMHLEQCELCAAKLRVIMIMRGVPATGNQEITPERMHELEADVERRVM
jgi:hypothetical protein